MKTRLFRELLQGIVHLFYPSLCEGCGKPLVKGEALLCVGCSLELPETDYHHLPDNETALRFAGRIPFIHATSYAYFTHEGLLQHLVHGLKYRDKKDTGLYLGRRFGTQLKATEWIAGIDIIVPVPLHKKKKAKRGYNQSMLVAEGMSGALGIPASEQILERVKNTDTQTKKTRIERVRNMEAAFRINKRAKIKGKHLLLVDDVLTTGATLEACALALMKEEGVKISIATIGIAGS